MKPFEVKITDEDERQVIRVYLNGDQVFEWYDNAQCDYPEDLCWHRMISEVFWGGVKAGQKLAATGGETFK